MHRGSQPYARCCKDTNQVFLTGCKCVCVVRRAVLYRTIQYRCPNPLRHWQIGLSNTGQLVIMAGLGFDYNGRQQLP